MKRFFLMLFAVFFMSFSGAVAQDWEWSQPKVITPDSAYVDIEFYPDYTEVNGSDDWITYAPLAFAGTKASTLMFSDDTISGNGIKSVFAPPVGFEYIIDNDTIAFVDGNDEIALDPQPIIPTLDGEFSSIAAGSDGELYILFDADNGTQYLLEGTSLNPLPEVTIRFTPRSLNLGSKGRWVSCKIRDFPDEYMPSDVDPDTLCIVAVNGVFLAEEGISICARDSGWPGKNKSKKKVKIKFDRRDLADFITDFPGQDPATADITVKGTMQDDLSFYGEDTIKVKHAKVKKQKKDK